MSSHRLLTIIIVLFFVIVIGTPLFYWNQTVFPYTIPKTAFFQTFVEIVFFLWAALAVSDRRYRLRMTPLVWAILAYLGILTITAFTGVDPLRSFFSTEQRAFGILTFYHLAALALVASALSRDIPWKKLFYASFGTSTFITALAALQLVVPNLLLDERVDRPGATFGNPTFLAGYLTFNILLAAYFFFESLKAGRKPARLAEPVFLFATILAGAVGVFLTQTRGDLLGLFAGILTLTALFAFRPPEVRLRLLSRRSVYVGLLMFLVVAAGTVWFTRTSSFWRHVPGLERIKDISLSDSAGSDVFPRIVAARAAWSGFLEKPLVGWGFENFNVVFSKYYDPRVLEANYSETNFDKPHSIVLEELVSGGVFLLVAYLAVLWLIIYEAKKTKDTLLFQFTSIAIAAYFVRSLFIFDTLGPAMMLYLFLGFIDGHVAQHPAEPRPHGVKQTVHPGAVLAALVPAMVLLWELNVTALSASHYQFLGYKQLGDNPQKGIADFRQATEGWNPYQWEFIRDNVNTIAQAYFYNHAMIARDEVVRLIDAMEGVAKDHPMDAYNHYLLTSVYNLASDIDPGKYLPAAEREAAKALELSPNRQEILFYLAKTKSLEGDNTAALEIAKRALDLDPKVADSHFYYGMLAFALGRNGEGYDEVNTAIKMGRPWHSFYEPRVAGDYFADAGHLGEAIDLYRAALMIQPSDLEAEIKLGAAYFINGRSDLARPLLQDAASRFDFSQSPQYGAYKPILDALGVAVHPATRP
jgi:tetratricopeptide (TPR) repeat protein